jgi:phosphosulfolactate phosphohydrolase-like enzyme
MHRRASELDSTGESRAPKLRQYGYPEDVHVAAEVDTSRSVPILIGDRFSGS